MNTTDCFPVFNTSQEDAGAHNVVEAGASSFQSCLGKFKDAAGLTGGIQCFRADWASAG